MLGGSWVVESGVIKYGNYIRGLIPPLITTHEPPSGRGSRDREETPCGNDRTSNSLSAAAQDSGASAASYITWSLLPSRSGCPRMPRMPGIRRFLGPTVWARRSSWKQRRLATALCTDSTSWQPRSFGASYNFLLVGSCSGSHGNIKARNNDMCLSILHQRRLMSDSLQSPTDHVDSIQQPHSSVPFSWLGSSGPWLRLRRKAGT